MDYIISPWIIYFIAVLSNIGITFALIGLISAIAAFLYLIDKKMDVDYSTDISWKGEPSRKQIATEEFKKKFPYIIKWLIVSCILIIISCLIPSRAEMTAMLIASRLTTDVVSTMGIGVKDFIDYVVTTIGAL